ncbi:hypothetical protein [Bradyrhizobium sp. Leo170]|uniref:hypothetical protein n=1 Tax=Bradyrhizobium sp. Leo170 TaxID=1571199 RepID=UPI00102ECA38|nr:hypothetical protein [Bradyrhizobium sp. Leo170]TAI67082.1 hypothetical protein CWO89_04905 [Bradyrhizobium sp. Leo170]
MAPGLFTYRLFDTSDGKRALFGIVNAAHIGEALEKASSLVRHHNTSRVEIESTSQAHSDGLGHLSMVAELAASKSAPCSRATSVRAEVKRGPDEGAVHIFSPEQIRKFD